jgi:hypothetical protein
MLDDDDCGAIGGMNEWQESRSTPEKTSPSAAMTTTDPRLEPSRRGGEAGD